MDRVIPLYSKSAVRRAGKLIGEGVASPDDITNARGMVSNYRSAHGYPLVAVAMHVRQRALAVSPDAVVARRLKRLPTIIGKLERHPNMNVTTMQDLGGCRAVMKSVDHVDALVSALEGSTRAQNKVVRKYDYLRSEPGPQQSGYRGVHLVYEYHASQREYDGLRVELQVRTALQHAWATSVETMDLFSGSHLKYSSGAAELKRYFVLVSGLMAAEEGLAPIPGAEESPAQLKLELKRLEKRNKVIPLLRGYAALVSEHATSNRRTFLTLELKRAEKVLDVKVHETQTSAERRLAELESRDDDNLDAVLVGIRQIGQLQSAYPNYYADTGVFTGFVSAAIA